MNSKLTKREYQHMLIELIAQSIERIPQLRQNATDEDVDWLYLIERLKTKGVLNDLRPARDNITARPRATAKLLAMAFNDDIDKDITTMT